MPRVSPGFHIRRATRNSEGANQACLSSRAGFQAMMLRIDFESEIGDTTRSAQRAQLQASSNQRNS